jgi:UPF0755 protein
MSDSRRERTEAEREAARLEREARRGGTLEEAEERPATEQSVAEAPATERPREQLPAKPLVIAARGQRGTRHRRPIRSPRTQSARRSLQPPTGRMLIVRRAIAVVVLAFALFCLWFADQLFQPFQGSGHGSVLVVIPPKSSSGAVGSILVKEGVISSSFFFELRATLAGDRGSLYSGRYHMPLDTSYGNALRILTTPPPPGPKPTGVDVEPGIARQQLSPILRRQGFIGDYLAATRHSKYLNPRAYGAPRRTGSLEGFLFPATYELTEPVKVSDLVRDQLEMFKQQFATVSMRYAHSKHLSPYDVLIIASLVQGEASTEQDLRLVASVIYNRLAQGIDLGLDSSTRYAVNNYTKPLTQAQLNSSSPWNTRNHKGLPPTPINSPNLAAISAAAHPPRTNYLYFVVRPCGDGSMTFTASYQQFEADSLLYQEARAKRGGKSPEFCKKKRG